VTVLAMSLPWLIITIVVVVVAVLLVLRLLGR
jgi:hypothetical protein